MPQTGRPGVVVKQLLTQYKKRCEDERKKHEQDGDRCPLDLFPVSFAHAKDWLLKKHRAQSEAFMAGAVNKTAREVITELSQSLDKPTTSAASLLEQPAQPASPVIPLPQLSLGPEPVTDEARAEERRKRAQERREQQGKPPANLLVKVRRRMQRHRVHRELRNQRLLIQRCKKDRREQKLVRCCLASLQLK